MLTIQFAYWYEKFKGVLDRRKGKENFATLLDAHMIRTEKFSQIFLDYDTLYFSENGHTNYKINTDQCLLLIFRAEKSGMLFTTIRTFNPCNLEKYINNIGKRYKLIIEGKNE